MRQHSHREHPHHPCEKNSMGNASTRLKRSRLIMDPQPDCVRMEPANLREHYEDVVGSALGSVGRHVHLIAVFVAIALISGGLLIWHLPRSYTAEALVQPDLFLRTEDAKRAPLASIEGASLVRSEAHLIGSPAIVRAVVQQTGLDDDPEFTAPSWPILQPLDGLRAAILPETAIASPLERAITRVRNRLAVANDTRSYLISVSFTASSPEKAAKVANAFAVEYLRVKAVQHLANAVSAAHRELLQRSTIYGERHPSVVQAKADLEAARIRMQAAVSRPEAAAREIVPSAITLAEPSTTPSSPNGRVILGLALACAAVSGIGLAIWLDRRNTRAKVDAGKGLFDGEAAACRVPAHRDVDGSGGP
jgi:uncharacterized protein involved in exopolysaccharide biosynthesis